VAERVKHVLRTYFCAACRRERFLHELEEDINGYYMCKGACPSTPNE